MRWYCLPATLFALAFGTTAPAAEYARYGRIANDELEAPAVESEAAPILESPTPAPAGNCGCGKGGGCGARGGFAGFSWAHGCCERQPSCCDGLWDDFCSQTRSLCSRTCSPRPRWFGGCATSGCATSSCATSGCASSGCASCDAAPVAMPWGRNGGCNECNTCSSGFGAPIAGWHHRVRGYARNCWTSLSGHGGEWYEGGTVVGDCGCGAGSAAPTQYAPQYAPSQPAPHPAAPVEDADPGIPSVEPMAPETLPQGTQAPGRPTGKTASRWFSPVKYPAMPLPW